MQSDSLKKTESLIIDINKMKKIRKFYMALLLRTLAV